MGIFDGKKTKNNRLRYAGCPKSPISVTNKFLRDCYESECANLTDDQLSFLMSMLTKWRLKKQHGRRPKLVYKMVRLPHDVTRYGENQLVILEYLHAVRVDTVNGILDHFAAVGLGHVTAKTIRITCGILCDRGYISKGTLGELLDS